MERSPHNVSGNREASGGIGIHLDQYIAILDCIDALILCHAIGKNEGVII